MHGNLRLNLTQTKAKSKPYNIRPSIPQLTTIIIIKKKMIWTYAQAHLCAEAIDHKEIRNQGCLNNYDKFSISNFICS